MKFHLENDATEGVRVGRDPRTLSEADLEAMGRPAISRGDAIRAKCLECCNRSPTEVRRCGMIDCALWPFRMGTNPYRERRQVSDEQRQAASERFAKARAMRAATVPADGA